MKAAVCRAFGEPLSVEELVLDSPREGEVLVRLDACAICHSDVAFAAGAWGGDLPAVYGHEGAGVVSAVGADVHGVARGDRVVVSLLRSCGRCRFCTSGEPHLCAGEFVTDSAPRLHTEAGEPVVQAMRTAAFAEEVVVHQSQVAPVPSGLSLDVASLLGCGVITGVGAVLDKVGVVSGSSVVVVGTGGVGLNTVQGAAIAGAETILALDVSPSKLETALAFGATHAVDPAQEDPVAVARSLTDGRGADYVFVTVGRGDVVERALRYARRGGTVAILGMPPNDETFEVVAVDLVHDDVSVVGCKIGAGSGTLREVVPRLVGLYEEGRLKLDELVSGRYPLERINEAIAAVEHGDAVRNVVTFGAA